MSKAPKTRDPNRFWNPYVAGVALGLVLLAAFVVSGRGLGASGAASRLGITVVDSVSSSAVDGNAYLARAKVGGEPILKSWFVFMALGVILGGFLAAYTSGRLKREVIRGPRISRRSRLLLALGGGILMGIGARLSLGCTSGQALTGGALLSVGSWVFMMMVFAGGYAVAPLVKKEWL
jgi:hypothetical protein